MRLRRPHIKTISGRFLPLVNRPGIDHVEKGVILPPGMSDVDSILGNLKIGPIDSTENVGLPWGVQSVESDGTPEVEDSILFADGVGGSTWRLLGGGGEGLEELILGESPDGLWKLNDLTGSVVAHDSSGNGRDLVVGSDTAPTWEAAAGPPGTVTAEFSSEAQRLHYDTFPLVDAGDFTVLGWVYFVNDDPADVYAIIGQGTNLGESGTQGWLLGIDGGGPTTHKLHLYIGIGPLQDEMFSNNGLTEETWYQVGFVRESGVFTLYVNGLAQADTSSASVNSTATLRLGSTTGAGSNFHLDGRASWWAIFGHALTGAQILEMYELGTTGGVLPADRALFSDGAGGTEFRRVMGEDVDITDSGAYFTATDVEGALAEIGAAGFGGVSPTLFDANTILKADTDNTPFALTMAASTILARLASGSIKAATPSELRTLLSLVVGTDVEAHDADLTTIAGLTPTNDDLLQRKAGAWTNRTIAQLLVDLAAAGTTFQPLDSDLTALAGLAIAADTLPYGSGSHAMALATFTAAGRALIDDADASAQLTTLGVSTFIKTLLDDTDAATARATLGITSTDGVWEIVMADGVTAPPVPVTNEAEDDWLYAFVEG